MCLLNSQSYYYLQYSQVNVSVNGKIGYGYTEYIDDRYVALFIAVFLGKYNSSSSDLFWYDAYFKGLDKAYKLSF